MNAVKRERLQYIYEQNKAKAIKEAVPNPVGLLSATKSTNLASIAASIIYMSVDSYSSYEAYNAEINLQYLQDGWKLDDEAQTFEEQNLLWRWMRQLCVVVHQSERIMRKDIRNLDKRSYGFGLE